MPRIIDYACRFEQIREAVYAVTLRDGAAAIGLETVAAEMGISRSTLCRLLARAEALPWLGRELVDRRERSRLILRGAGHEAPGRERWQLGLGELLSYLPVDDVRVDEARVRAAITSMYADRDPRLREADAHREAVLVSVIERLLTSCGADVSTGADDAGRLLVLVHGITHQVCADRLTTADARRLVTVEVERVAYPREGRVA